MRREYYGEILAECQCFAEDVHGVEVHGGCFTANVSCGPYILRILFNILRARDKIVIMEECGNGDILCATFEFYEIYSSD